MNKKTGDSINNKTIESDKSINLLKKARYIHQSV